MLNYSTMQVVNSNAGRYPFPWLFVIMFTALILFVSYSLISCSGSTKSGIIVGIVLLCMFFSLFHDSGYFNNLALIKIEVENIQMIPNVYRLDEPKPNESECYLKKEGDKVYYFDVINPKALDTPDKITEDAERKFLKLVFNLNGNNPSGENNAYTSK